VALLLPPPHATEVDGLRRALADRALQRVPPHLTLVPPVNVRVEAVPDALAVVRGAAATVEPFSLRLGPPTSFAPVTPTLHLAVSGPDGEPGAADGRRAGSALATLHRLRDAVFLPPLERPLTFPFEPHVTLADDVDPERIPASVQALEGYVVEVTFERVHVLEERRDVDGRRRWVPVADVPLRPTVVVGRGGVELELTTSTLLDPEAMDFEAREWPDDLPPIDVAPPLPACWCPLVVTARRRGRVVGVVRGRSSSDRVEVASLLVAAAERRQGISHHLLAAFRHEAAHR
jgi:2'-5' RNA ligase